MDQKIKTIAVPIPKQSAKNRMPWVAPTVEELPRLTDLTLATGDPIDGGGGTGGGGGTVF